MEVDEVNLIEEPQASAPFIRQAETLPLSICTSASSDFIVIHYRDPTVMCKYECLCVCVFVCFHYKHKRQHLRMSTPTSRSAVLPLLCKWKWFSKHCSVNGELEHGVAKIML